jgi:hypothetical protein
MQITLPDDARIQQRASAAGFATVEEYLLQLVERDADSKSDSASPFLKRREEWIREFRAFIATMKPRHAHLDDSRESMYPVR